MGSFAAYNDKMENIEHRYMDIILMWNSKN